jgi:hypothetical protein
MSLSQPTLPLFDRGKRRNASRPVIVTLSDSDTRYRDELIATDKPFPHSFLCETRAQRLKLSVETMVKQMLNYELNLHLADEAILMRLPTWETEPAMYIDWSTIDQRAKQRSQEWSDDFAAFRKHRLNSLKPKSSIANRKS